VYVLVPRLMGELFNFLELPLALATDLPSPLANLYMPLRHLMVEFMNTREPRDAVAINSPFHQVRHLARITTANTPLSPQSGKGHDSFLDVLLR
jgi:hypothetical protein